MTHAYTGEFNFELGEVDTPTKVYPPGQATVLGEQLALEHIDPMMSFSSLDRRYTFHFEGAMAPWPRQQDGVLLVEITPPSPDFKQLKSKAARQHGVTRNATVFNENEIHIVLKAFGVTPERLGEVVSDFEAMWDPRKLVRFEWLTFDKGLWWCDCYMGKSWQDRLVGSPRRRKQQIITQVIENPTAFWRSVDSLSQFVFRYEDFADNFTTEHLTDMGPDWPLWFTGSGGGYPYIKNSMLRWRDDPDDQFTTQSRRCIFGPRKGFATDTDNQVITAKIATPPEWSLPASGRLLLGGRMNSDEDDEWLGDGVFAEIGFSDVEIARYNNFVRTPIARAPLFPPPFWNETYTFLPGRPGNARTFTVLRNGAVVLRRTESGTGSMISAEHRGIGGGMAAGGAAITQATPPFVHNIKAGDNAKVTQTGFLTLTNVGSEDGWATFILRGPFDEIGIGNGPGSTEMITFGPLYENQQVLISTHPRYRNVIDLTTSGTLTGKQRAEVEDMARLVALGQVPPVLSWYESVFGVLPPQGNLYKQLKGRFSRAIPGVDQPSDAVESKIAVSVTGGNADTRVLAAVTPQRRWPE